jgi:hypothetical protein
MNMETIKKWWQNRKREKAAKDLEKELQDRMTRVDEMLDLKEVTDIYAKYVCMMHGWDTTLGGYVTDHFCEVSLSFMNGYIKALHDNGLKFERGLVKKRDITEEMPCGALDYYRKDAIRETKAFAIDKLREVMERFETSKTNITTIVRAFEKEMEVRV